MADLSWTREAEFWLRDIHNFIAEGNPAAAAAVVKGIQERAHQLTFFPALGYKYQNSSRAVRILPFGHYRIAYIVKENDVIDILGVFHGSLDIDRYLI